MSPNNRGMKARSCDLFTSYSEPGTALTQSNSFSFKIFRSSRKKIVLVAVVPGFLTRRQWLFRLPTPTLPRPRQIPQRRFCAVIVALLLALIGAGITMLEGDSRIALLIGFAPLLLVSDSVCLCDPCCKAGIITTRQPRYHGGEQRMFRGSHAPLR